MSTLNASRHQQLQPSQDLLLVQVNFLHTADRLSGS